jgi:TRAP-type C4-dicarboxylate transport system substrate-binding protein
MEKSVRSGSRSRFVALVATSLFVLAAAGCAEQGGGAQESGDTGEAVEYGAEKQVYIDALADMEPVTLTMQSSAPKGAATGRRFEEYAAAVEEWSGGKITFELAFSNAIAPPAEVDNAIADTRLDMGSVIVALEPSVYPATNGLWDLSFMGRQTPVDGLLQWHGIMVEAATNSDEIYAEYEAQGMKVLLPTFSSGSYFVDCAEPGTDLSALRGRSTASQSRIQNIQAQALGMTPATVNYAEMFDSLQRGVVDCALSTMTVSSLGGFIPAAPHFAYDPTVGLASPGGSIAIGLERWNSLPLAAQQLLYDRLDVLLQANFEATWDNIDAALQAIAAANGGVEELSDDAVAALEEANEGVLDEARSNSELGDGDAFVDGVNEAADFWASEVEGLGIDGVDVDYDGFAEWHAAGAPDLQPYFDALWERALDKRRPS